MRLKAETAAKQHSMITAPAEKPFNSGVMAWAEFRANLENVDMVCAGDRDQLRSQLVDSRFGDLHIRHVGSQGAGLRCERSRSRIDAFRQDLIWVCLVLDGNMRITQQQVTAELNTGDFALVDALQPYAMEIPARAVDTLWIGSPRALAANHIWDLGELLGVRIDGRKGPGQIASRVLHAAFANTELLPESAANRIAHGLMDVLGTAVDGYRMQQGGSRYNSAVVRRIKNYIEEHLDEETLTVAKIASAQGVSPRYLAKVFESQSQTVSGWIWDRRLERCRQALLHASGKTISEIAYAHGFKNTSHFSRVFKDRFGTSPRSLFETGERTA